jgi:hypothetical protein
MNERKSGHSRVMPVNDSPFELDFGVGFFCDFDSESLSLFVGGERSAPSSKVNSSWDAKVVVCVGIGPDGITRTSLDSLTLKVTKIIDK